MAARLRPDRTSAEHQSLLHSVRQSPWDEVALLRAADSERRAKAGVPEEVVFRTRPGIALAQIEAALSRTCRWGRFRVARG